jgi:hypothetical protein
MKGNTGDAQHHGESFDGNINNPLEEQPTPPCSWFLHRCASDGNSSVPNGEAGVILASRIEDGSETSVPLLHDVVPSSFFSPPMVQGPDAVRWVESFSNRDNVIMEEAFLHVLQLQTERTALLQFASEQQWELSGRRGDKVRIGGSAVSQWLTASQWMPSSELRAHFVDSSTLMTDGAGFSELF